MHHQRTRAAWHHTPRSRRPLGTTEPTTPPPSLDLPLAGPKEPRMPQRGASRRELARQIRTHLHCLVALVSQRGGLVKAQLRQRGERSRVVVGSALCPLG